jgi:lipopolysaccharide transport system permease protein
MASLDSAQPARTALPPRDAPTTPPSTDPRVTHLRPRRGWARVDLGELWRSRELLWMFIVRDVKVRYKQTFFGYAWALLVPAIQVLVFSVFFGAVLGVGEQVSEAAGKALPYPLFALTGQIVWNFFKASVDGGSTSLVANAAIVRKVYVPRLALPVAALGKPAADTLVVYLLLFGMMAWYLTDPAYDVALTAKVLLSPVLLLATAVPALAIGLLTSAITVHYRDLTYVLPFAVSILFYVTPVIYSVDLLPQGYGWLLYLNPVAGLVEAHRACLMDLPIPWRGLAMSAVISTVLLVAGAFVFTRAERHFADVA